MITPASLQIQAVLYKNQPKELIRALESRVNAGRHDRENNRILGEVSFSWLFASRAHLVFIKHGSRTFLFFECLLVSSCSSGDSLQGRLPFNYI